MDCFEHTIRLGALKVVTKTTDVIHGSKPQTNVSELLSFFWCNVFHRFFTIFSRAAASLNAEVKKSEPKSFELDETKLEMME